MSVLIGIPYSITDYPYWLDRTINSFRSYLGRDVDVLVVTDEGTVYLNGTKEGRFMQTWVPGFGVGKALNAIAYYAVRRKYDVLLKTDGHVLVAHGIEKLLDKRMSQPRVTAVEKPSNLVADILSTPRINPGGDYNIYLEKDDWRWGYILETNTYKSIMTAEPVFEIKVEALEALIEVQGEVTMYHYWGKEEFDLTFSTYRLLGWDMDLVKDALVAHVYKVGTPSSWTRRMRMPAQREPFYPYMKPNEESYIVSMQWGDVIYSLKHYNKCLPMVRRDFCEIIMNKDSIMARIREFNKNARIDTERAYEVLYKQYLRCALIWHPGEKESIRMSC